MSTQEALKDIGLDLNPKKCSVENVKGASKSLMELELGYRLHLEHPQPVITDIETDTDVPIKKIGKQLKGAEGFRTDERRVIAGMAADPKMG